MVGKRWLLPIPFVIALVALLIMYAYNPFSSTSVRTSFEPVIGGNLLWSGQNEGETVSVVPHYQQSVGGIFVPPFSRYSLSEGIAEARKQGMVPLVPTLLPVGMVYADVYIGPTVDVCFSYNKTEDPSYADLVIEMHGVSTVPSIDDIKKNLWQGAQLFQVGDKWVEILNDYYHNPDTGFSWATGEFFYGNVHYIVSAKYPLTNQDLTTIIGSMKTPS